MMNPACIDGDPGTDDDTLRYYPQYSEFRGHARTDEVGPDGRVTSTWFRQDDAAKGQPVLSLVSTQVITDSFSSESLDSFKWAAVNVTPAIERSRGDTALKFPNGNFSRNIHTVTNPLNDGQAVLIDFLHSGGEAVLALEKGQYPGSDYRRWGIWIQSDGKVVAQYHDGYSYNDPCSPPLCDQYDHKVLIPSGGFVRNAWYSLLLIVDQQVMYLRLWPRDDPGSANYFSLANITLGVGWNFYGYTNNGDLWLDDYRQGQIYTLNETDYETGAPVQAAGNPSAELAIYWPHPVFESTLTFEGDGQLAGKSTYYFYHTDGQGVVQYGNLKQTVESGWEGDSWQDYRLTWTGYYPRDLTDPVSGDITYLVGLPAFTNQYECPAGSGSGSCKNNLENLMVAPLWANDYLLSSVLYLYDDHQSFTTPPDDGELTRERVLTRFAGPDYTDLRYADTTYEYDEWGNRTKVTGFGDEGSESGLATGSPSVTRTCYGQATPDLVCANDGYYTYPTREKNAEDHVTGWAYDYAFGLPEVITDTNDQLTLAWYDEFGRLERLDYPGDDIETSPTISVTYDLISMGVETRGYWSPAGRKSMSPAVIWRAKSIMVSGSSSSPKTWARYWTAAQPTSSRTIGMMPMGI